MDLGAGCGAIGLTLASRVIWVPHLDTAGSEQRGEEAVLQRSRIAFEDRSELSWRQVPVGKKIEQRLFHELRGTLSYAANLVHSRQRKQEGHVRLGDRELRCPSGTCGIRTGLVYGPMLPWAIGYRAVRGPANGLPARCVITVCRGRGGHREWGITTLHMWYHGSICGITKPQMWYHGVMCGITHLRLRYHGA